MKSPLGKQLGLTRTFNSMKNKSAKLLFVGLSFTTTVVSAQVGMGFPSGAGEMPAPEFKWRPIPVMSTGQINRPLVAPVAPPQVNFQPNPPANRIPSPRYQFRPIAARQNMWPSAAPWQRNRGGFPTRGVQPRPQMPLAPMQAAPSFRPMLPPPVQGFNPGYPGYNRMPNTAFRPPVTSFNGYRFRQRTQPPIGFGQIRRRPYRNMPRYGQPHYPGYSQYPVRAFPRVAPMNYWRPPQFAGMPPQAPNPMVNHYGQGYGLPQFRPLWKAKPNGSRGRMGMSKDNSVIHNGRRYVFRDMHNSESSEPKRFGVQPYQRIGLLGSPVPRHFYSSEVRKIERYVMPMDPSKLIFSKSDRVAQQINY